MTPLDNYYNLKRGYTFGKRTFYNSFHVGTDIIVPVGTALYAPFTGGVVKKYSSTGGYMLEIFPDGLPYVLRYMHLSKYLKLGRVIEGEVIALSGKSGSYVRGAHLHIEVWKDMIQPNKRSAMIDPDKFSFEIINHTIMFIRRPDGQISLLTPEKKRYVLLGPAWEKLGRPYAHNFTDQEYNKYPEAGVIKDIVL